MSGTTGSRWFVIALLSIGITVAALFVYVRWSTTSINGFYKVTDSLIDGSGQSVAAAYFVRVESYDTTKILRVGAELASQVAAESAFDRSRARTLLMHFFESTDTSALSDVELDELAYTNPELSNPGSRLLAVRNGYVLASTYAAGADMPSDPAALRKATFYMPRPGFSAKDLR
ncbi:MAG: hypothetical protein FGM24_06620 [Candidatus Kapabacteria bacterium]|nr:hypothetical protein [Candidatus Kapabacteria bacterium]